MNGARWVTESMNEGPAWMSVFIDGTSNEIPQIDTLAGYAFFIFYKKGYIGFFEAQYF